MDNTLTATPPPQSFEIQLPNLTLTVPDMAKPLWHGLYYTGKLSIYNVQVSGVGVIPDSSTVIAIFNQEGGPEFLVYATYELTVSNENIVQHLQQRVQSRYLEVLAEHTPVSIGNTTVH